MSDLLFSQKIATAIGKLQRHEVAEAHPALELVDQAKVEFENFDNTKDLRLKISKFAKAAELLYSAAELLTEMPESTHKAVIDFRKRGAESLRKRVFIGNAQSTAREFDDLCIQLLDSINEESQRSLGHSLSDALDNVLGEVFKTSNANSEFSDLALAVGAALLKEDIIQRFEAENGTSYDRTIRPLGELSEEDLSFIFVSSRAPDTKKPIPLVVQSGLLGSEEYSGTRDRTRMQQAQQQIQQARVAVEFELPETILWPKLPHQFMGMMKAFRELKDAPVDNSFLESLAQSLGITDAALTQRLRKLFSFTTEPNFPLAAKERRPMLLSCKMLMALIDQMDRSKVQIPYCASREPSGYVSFPRIPQ